MFGVYVFFFVCAVLCLGRGLGTSWSLVQGVVPPVNKSGNWKEARAHKGCRATQEEGEEEEEEEEDMNDCLSFITAAFPLQQGNKQLSCSE
jgi:hypothetical protein